MWLIKKNHIFSTKDFSDGPNFVAQITFWEIQKKNKFYFDRTELKRKQKLFQTTILEYSDTACVIYRFFRCNNCFLLLVYTIHLSLRTDLVDPPPIGNHLYETCVAKTIYFVWNLRMVRYIKPYRDPVYIQTRLRFMKWALFAISEYCLRVFRPFSRNAQRRCKKEL